MRTPRLQTRVPGRLAAAGLAMTAALLAIPDRTQAVEYTFTLVAEGGVGLGSINNHGTVATNNAGRRATRAQDRSGWHDHDDRRHHWAAEESLFRLQPAYDPGYQ